MPIISSVTVQPNGTYLFPLCSAITAVLSGTKLGAFEDFFFDRQSLDFQNERDNVLNE
jgi:hypothetical protein